MAKIIHSSKARKLCYSWHSGQWSALYAVASSGLIEDLQSLLREIDGCATLASTKAAVRELNSLHRYFSSSIIASIPGRYPHATPWHFSKA